MADDDQIIVATVSVKDILMEKLEEKKVALPAHARHDTIQLFHQLENALSYLAHFSVETRPMTQHNNYTMPDDWPAPEQRQHGFDISAATAHTRAFRQALAWADDELRAAMAAISRMEYRVIQQGIEDGSITPLQSSEPTPLQSSEPIPEDKNAS